MRRNIKRDFTVSVWFAVVVIAAAAVSGPPSAAAQDPPFAGLDILLVLDNSGSMKASDPEFRTVTFVSEFASSVPTSAHLGLIIFDESTRVALPLTPVAGDGFSEVLSAALKQVDYRGLHTASPNAVERAIYELKHNGRTDASRLIIFLTDGIVDTGDAARDREQSDWLRNILTEDAARHGIRIFSIAFTENADFQLIQTVAQKTGGDYFRATRLEDIQRIFGTIHTLLIPPPAPTEAPAATVAPTPESLTGSPVLDRAWTAVEPHMELILIGFGFVIVVIIIIAGIRRSRNRKEPSIHPMILKMAQTRKPGGKKEPYWPSAQKKDPSTPPASSDRHPLEMELPDLDATYTPPDNVPDTEPVKENRPATRPIEDDLKDAVGELFPELKSPDDDDTPARGRVSKRLAVIHDLGRITNTESLTMSQPVFNIGRLETDNDLVIPVRTVSKRHARIEFRDNLFFLVDLRSSNGTFLNHTRVGSTSAITEMQLQSGDQIGIDKFQFRFESLQEEAPDKTMLREVTKEELAALKTPKGDPFGRTRMLPNIQDIDPDPAGSPRRGKPTGPLPEPDPFFDELDSGGIDPPPVDLGPELFPSLDPDDEPESDSDSTPPIGRRFSAKCYNHPDQKAPRICTVCGNTFCPACIADVEDRCICKECAEVENML